MAPHNRDTLLAAFQAEVTASGDRQAALKKVMKLFLASSEFHTSATVTPTGGTRDPTGGGALGGKRPFKAIIVVFEDGGTDSFNRLVPTGGCGDFDLHAEYVLSPCVHSLACTYQTLCLCLAFCVCLDRSLLRLYYVPFHQCLCRILQ